LFYGARTDIKDKKDKKAIDYALNLNSISLREELLNILKDKKSVMRECLMIK
jgi:hypothetical protein